MNKSPLKKIAPAFTIVEVLAAMIIVGMIAGSVMVVINNCIESIDEMCVRQEAFELAKENIEKVLLSSKVKESIESGTSDINPEVECEVKIRAEDSKTEDGGMWVQATITSTFKDENNKPQTIEFNTWLTKLTEAEEKQLLRERAIWGNDFDSVDPVDPADPDVPVEQEQPKTIENPQTMDEWMMVFDNPDLYPNPDLLFNNFVQWVYAEYF